MRPFDEEPDYSDVALLVASVREWPSDDFARDLDARVARRFAPETPRPGSRPFRLGGWGRIAAGPAVALVAGAVAVVVVLSNGGGSVNNGAVPPLKPVQASQHSNAGAAHGGTTKRPPTDYGGRAVNTTATFGAPTSTNGAASAGTGQAQRLAPPTIQTATSAPVAPGSKQIRSAQISLTTPNQHVNQVASEVFLVVSAQHGSVLSSHITSATTNSGGGYATFSLSIPTSNLQTAMTQLSQLHFAALASSTAGSQNVSNQYNSDQRQLADATALRTSLLKQLQTAYTQSAIDSIKAQLKLAEQQINTWQSALGSLQHRISYSNVTVQVNAGGLPVVPVAKQSSSFTIGRAGHDALRVLVVSAGVALIALAVALPIGLLAALLVWLWVWLRQRRREHALDAAS
jgi:Domain of unknown function (DUF4349)